IFLHLYTITKYPHTKIVSDEILLGMALTLIGYVCIQALKDRYRLRSLNIALVKAQHQLEREEIETISALVLTEEAKDPYTRGHSKRVSELSVAVAREMGFSKERQLVIERAGLLHDLGKLGIVDKILKKLGELNDEEWGIIKRHARKGVQILAPLRFLSEEKKIVLHHHERYDGKGYPGKLKDKDIPLESRILAVCDTFDAMNSDRPYRDTLSREAIISELKKV
ncbi:unnamed protein product, partial [marine sediment metagenome]